MEKSQDLSKPSKRVRDSWVLLRQDNADSSTVIAELLEVIKGNKRIPVLERDLQKCKLSMVPFRGSQS